MKDGRYSSSYDAFVADPQYRFTRDIWYHDERIRQAQTRNSKIVIHLKDQRGVLWVNGQPAMNFPVCTGRSTHETPRGKFSHHSEGCGLPAPGPMAACLMQAACA